MVVLAIVCSREQDDVLFARFVATPRGACQRQSVANFEQFARNFVPLLSQFLLE